MNANRAIFGWGAAFACLIASIIFRHEIGDLLNPSPQRIQAQIQLDNRCKLQEQSFVVRDLNTGKYAPFRNGVARLRTTERNRVRIEFAPRFVDAELSLASFPAKAQMTLVAHCYSKGSWLKDLFG